MSQSPTATCPRCGRALASAATPCPTCLLERALAGGGSAPFVATAAGADATASDLPDPAELARHFPRLEIGALLGRGASGSVWRARQLELSRDVALKVLAPELSRDPAFEARFEREARALAALDHPHIVRVYDYGKAGPYSFLVMELVDGASLRELLREGRLGRSEILTLASDICAALAYAHARGVVHRDIKPENLLVDAGGRAKVADFGLAKLVGPAVTPSLRSSGGARVGTPLYMAPEQLERPTEVDHRADLYALGVVLYELLTGELPIGRFEPPSQRGSPDARLDPVVLRALEKDPARRQRDAAEVERELARASSAPAPDPATVTAAPAGAAPSQPRELRYSYMYYLLIATAMIGLNKLPVSEQLRSTLLLLAFTAVAAAVAAALLWLRGTPRGRGLQTSVCALGAAYALVLGFESDALLHALHGTGQSPADFDRALVRVLAFACAAIAATWMVFASRRAVRAVAGRRRWRLWIGSALNAALGALLLYGVLHDRERTRIVALPIVGTLFIVDFWVGKRARDLEGPLVRGSAGPGGKCIVLEYGGKRGVAWVRKLRAVTKCSLAQAQSAKRTSAEWEACVELSDAEAEALIGRLQRAQIAARVAPPGSLLQNLATGAAAAPHSPNA